MKKVKIIIHTIIVLSMIGCTEQYRICYSREDANIFVRSTKKIGIKDLEKIDFLNERCDTTMEVEEYAYLKAIAFYNYNDSINDIKIMGYNFKRFPYYSYRYANGCSEYFSLLVYIGDVKYILGKDKVYNEKIFNKILSLIDNEGDIKILNKYRNYFLINNYCISYDYKDHTWR